MDHHFKVGATEWDGHEDDYYKGRKPIGFLFHVLEIYQEISRGKIVRGYGMQGSASRESGYVPWANFLMEKI